MLLAALDPGIGFWRPLLGEQSEALALPTAEAVAARSPKVPRKSQAGRPRGESASKRGAREGRVTASGISRPRRIKRFFKRFSPYNLLKFSPYRFLKRSAKELKLRWRRLFKSKAKCILSDAVVSWRKVKLNSQGVEAEAFLNAAKATVALLDRFGFGARRIQKEMNGGIRQLQTSIDAAKKSSRGQVTLESMITEEIAREGVGVGDVAGAVTCELKWLTRLLRIWAKAFRELSKFPAKTFLDCVKVSYDSVLRQHHTWIHRKASYLGFTGLPYRQTVLATLGDNPSEVESNFKLFAEAAAPVLRQLQEFMVGRGLEETDK